MPRPLISPRAQSVLATILFFAAGAIGIVIVGIWVALLVYVMGWPGRTPDFQRALQAFGLSLAVLCATFWGSHHVGLIELDHETLDGIWKTLIVAVLTTVAGGVAAAIPGHH